MSKDYLKKLEKITTFIFDVDGVLTDGSLLVLNTGELLRKMSIKDGYALKLAVNKGYNILIITGGESDGVLERLKGLGIKDIFTGISKKEGIYNKYVKSNKLQPQNILYMGDDLPDLEIMQCVGLPTCPNDAAVEIKNISEFISHKSGGQGCVREVIEMVLKSQNRWMEDGDLQW
ncbi:HAD hydrolase family protein [Candidatus Amoebophilus asiaticus]|nr:HAD hydrolase family protein [Candidatus Amoebophilus asiaticus]